ncbi:uncharacterized protein [Dermacentor andersoni]|uniref:uncharacterized protein isoform X4 n=1 Tax=Dermacentor andersoni TaxID=34620 RepID=UPI003B3A8185
MFRQRRLRASFQHFSLLHGPRQLRCQFSGSCQRIARRIFLLARSSSLVGSGHSGYNEQQHAARSQRDPHVVDWGYDRHRAMIRIRGHCLPCLSKNDQCHSGEAYLS